MKYLLLLFSIVTTLQGFSQSRISYVNYEATLQENFDYQNLDALSQNWTIQSTQPAKSAGTALYSPAQVSLLPQGGIRLTATPLTNLMAAREPKGKDFYYRSGMISKDLKENYGIYEIIAKLPNGLEDAQDAWPVFQLVGDHIQINIFDGHANINDDLRQNVHKSIDQETQYQCGHSWDLEDFHKGWDKGFHVFQVAWTPESVTFFIHGREVSTIPADQLELPIESMKMVVALQTGDATSQPMQMDIKKINVYRHKEGRPFSYLMDNSWEFHTATSDDTKVLAQNRAIVPNPSNSHEVFYIGQDHHLYLASGEGNHWTTRKIGNQNIGRSLIYVNANDMLLYRDDAGYLSGFFRKDNDFIPFSKQNIKLAEQPSVLASTRDGQVVAILANQKIVSLANGSLSVLAMAPIDYRGDLTLTPDNTILYKDSNNKLSALKQDELSFTPVALPYYQVSDAPGSILFNTFNNSGQGIAFRGTDDKFHLLEKTGDQQYRHSIPAYNYGFQDPQHPDYIASNLAGGLQDVFYLSEDGRLQLFGWNTERTQRQHFWVDDNFFTQKYLADIQAPSLAFGHGGQLFYRTRHGSLGYFNWEHSSKDCTCRTLHADKEENFNLISDMEIKVYPNPTTGRLLLTLNKGNQDDVYQYELVAANGQSVRKGSFEGKEYSFDFSNEPSGIYQLNIISGTNQYTKRLVKIK
ncbi:MAG TPA: T9SS type A sorting domain-containing protein [Saprospiraceae bacterium]|nr:T9SS type A sorting domain-containing protein [Saprospiraceae bacterium]